MIKYNMNKPLRLHILISNNRDITSESLERCVNYEKNLSVINRVRYNYYVNREFTKNIFHTLWYMFWW